MSERRVLGEILLNTGRVTPEDVERALEYQRVNGGRFGEALVALGTISPEEKEWGLASQYDLPYVFPDPSAVDPDAAALVSPEWALANLAIPIMRAGSVLTVVVDAPARSRAVETLEETTGLTVQLALASPARIRDLIRQVYARGPGREDERAQPHPVTLADALDAAQQSGTRRFGISARGHRAWFWYDDGGTTRRTALDAYWEAALDQVMDPPPRSILGEKPSATFSGMLVRGGVATPVDVRCLAGGNGLEILLRPVEEDGFRIRRVAPPPESLVAEVRLLAGTGSARFLVEVAPAGRTREILPLLPSLLLEPPCRSVHVHAEEAAETGEAFSVALPPDPSAWGAGLDGLRAFHFDAATVDLPSSRGEWLAAALDVAGVAFILWDGDPATAKDAGIRWRLAAALDDEGHVAWSLDPLET